MQFGMFTEFHIRQGGTESEAFDQSFELVDMAEQLGLDAVWLAEHHFSPERSVLASPIVIASAIAARTQRLRIGLAVQVLPLTNPLRVAEEAATVDHISKGRFDFGIGRSGLTRYYQGYNIPYDESRSRFAESLEIITKAWTQDCFSHCGDYFSFDNVTVVPRPYQQPYPPMYVAVSSPETFEAMGRLGHSVFLNSNTPVPTLQERLALYHRAWKEAGHSGIPEIGLRIPAYVAETADRARSEPEASTMHAIQYGAQTLSSSAATPEAAARMMQLASVSYDEVLKRRVMYGTPEAVVERCQALHEALGVTCMVLELNYGGQLPVDRVVHSIRLLTEKVMPVLR
ncbi:LLM class flavin-dependent oxidoreductase [Candidatus Entotheonella palauensis]|uniref:LLM class flavin-dependent oxidoreductase n=1 Tax=Candidatus Entotheonella palauensis TaxID=93172 RepID=UPI000B7E157F|nr:LLM class flavin-dependent oxidoreductase [Candidatus Entotheonella palauensis]